MAHGAVDRDEQGDCARDGAVVKWFSTRVWAFMRDIEDDRFCV